MSLIIDTQGWLGNAPIELNYWRVAAMVCIACALLCIYLANSQTESISKETESKTNEEAVNVI